MVWDCTVIVLFTACFIILQLCMSKKSKTIRNIGVFLSHLLAQYLLLESNQLWFSTARFMNIPVRFLIANAAVKTLHHN